MRSAIYGLVLVSSLVGACANDPIYLNGSSSMEAGQDDGTGMPVVAKQSLMLPIKPETKTDAAARAKLAASLGVMVPYVKVGDIDVEIEYTITNLDTNPGQAFIDLNGANEYYIYDPSMLNYTPPGSDDPIVTPPLAGNIPIDMEASGTYSGVFREDQYETASIDLDEVTQGNYNPYTAILNIAKNEPSFGVLSPSILLTTCVMQPIPAASQALCASCEANPDDPSCGSQPTGMTIPRAAFAEIIRVDLVFHPSTHMKLDYNVRIRDHRGIVNDLGMEAFTSDPTGVTMFMPVEYAMGAAN
ncbi:MAG TPA: hypothetical protein VMV37_04995 [Gammaproteobacteria bacterium]|nr:hypothetical protein [Gammaproteobacteria bacterium]